MAEKKTGAKKVDLQAVEESITAASRKLDGSALLKQGSILVRITDTGDACCVEGTGREYRLTRSPVANLPLVEIAGPAAVIKAVLDGKREASRAFIAGGIQVRGDVQYLEALLKELGVLKCE